ncbi:MAG TPA: MAPEG family protein [Novosphingobium sp.]|nr:MAPEG family protein [Novosphingobium sp.]
MHTEILILAWGAVLLMANILIAIQLKTRQYGRDWNAGNRDGEMPPPGEVAARVSRAQANLAETFPVAMVALLGVVLAGRTSDTTALGGWIWLGARFAYLAVYWAGIKYLRSLVYLVSLIGLAMVLWPLLRL